MTSEHTKAATESFFKKHSYFGLEADNIILFEQGRLPCLTFGGKIILEAPGRVALAPGEGVMHTYMHAYTHMRAHTLMQECTHTGAHTHTHTCTSLLTHTHTHTHTHTCFTYLVRTLNFSPPREDYKKILLFQENG